MDSSVSSTDRLYSPGQIALASFLGGPIAACWFLSRNCQRLDQARTGRNCLIWGVVGTVVVMVAGWFLPENFPSMVIPLGYTIGLYQTARQMHGSAVSEHLAAGGRLGSWGAVVGVGLLCCAVILGLFVGAAFLLPE